MNTLENIIIQNRSYRRFDSNSPIEKNTLIYLIDQARKVASGKNVQPLKYRCCFDDSETSAIFPLLTWASLYKDWSGPEKSERPVAYIIMCMDKELSLNDATTWCDIGIAAQTILLCATERNIGGCLIGAFNKKLLSEIMRLPTKYVPKLVIALGKPIESVVLEEKDVSDSSIAYYRDENGVQHVPKRTINEILLNIIQND